MDSFGVLASAEMSQNRFILHLALYHLKDFSAICLYQERFRAPFLGKCHAHHQRTQLRLQRRRTLFQGSACCEDNRPIMPA
jgi:hypothetical protein